MTTEKKEILKKINNIIDFRIKELLNKLPNFHTIDDGFIVRYFTEWDYCDNNNNIKYKKIKNSDYPNELSYFFFIPKDATFDYDDKEVKQITCLSGGLLLDTEKKFIEIKPYTKNEININKFSGRALENTYLVASNTID